MVCRPLSRTCSPAAEKITEYTKSHNHTNPAHLSALDSFRANGYGYANVCANGYGYANVRIPPPEQMTILPNQSGE